MQIHAKYAQISVSLSIATSCEMNFDDGKRGASWIYTFRGGTIITRKLKCQMWIVNITLVTMVNRHF